jgi:N-acetyl-gamma-glutamyl-phosphate reductase
MIRVGIVGATGYGGRELIRLLLAHPGAEITALASTSVAGEEAGHVLPAFRDILNLRFEPFNPAALAAKCDVVYMAVPSKESMEPAAELVAEGVRVIDIGPDFRLKDARAWEQYYGAKHRVPNLLAESVYGMPAYYREQLATAKLVAVPGCYPISIITALRPLLDAPLSDVPVVIDSVSGASGAGRSLSEPMHFAELNENVKAYKLGGHQHIPEIEQELLGRCLVQFTPHVGPYTRGILTTITLRPTELFDPAPYFERYRSEPFVRVLGEGVYPEVKYVRASNYCDVGWHRDKRTGNLLLVSAVDNLMGGTAGMAIQCMNIQFGLDETAGLRFGGMTP